MVKPSKYSPTRCRQYGVLKHPERDPDRINGPSSTENLVSSTSLSQVASNSSSLTMTVHDPERKDKGKDGGDEVVDVPHHEKKSRIHFPEGVENSPPDPYSRQDSDVTGSLSIATDEDDSEHYDWSDEEDLVDEEAKFRGQMGQKTKKSGWGFKRSADSYCSHQKLMLKQLQNCFIALLHAYWLHAPCRYPSHPWCTLTGLLVQTTSNGAPTIHQG